MRVLLKFKLLLLLSLSFLLFTGCQPTEASQDLILHVLDVGQGDSILITTPHQKTILIDAGESQKSEEVIKYLKNNKITKIDILVGTHPHSDHIGGLAEVIKNFEIGEFFMPPVIHTSKTFENVLLAADERNLKITAGGGEEVINLADDLSVRFLGPLRDYGDQLNNWSIVLQVQYKDKSFIFMGDAEHEAELDIISKYPATLLRSHFIKMGHHGSNTSTSEELLTLLRPDIAVISSGKNNSYGHPHKETLQRIKEHKINLYRTDQQGTLHFYSDGERIWSNIPPIK